MYPRTTLFAYGLLYTGMRMMTLHVVLNSGPGVAVYIGGRDRLGDSPGTPHV